MFDEFENFSAIQAQAFPHRIAALHGGIEGADASLITVQKFSVDVDDQVAVFFVEGLKHGDAMMIAKNNCGKSGGNSQKLLPFVAGSKPASQLFFNLQLEYLWDDCDIISLCFLTGVS